MSVFYFMSSFGYGEPLKKILSCEAGYSAYEYEYTYHYVRLNNSYYQTPMWFCDYMGVCCNTPPPLGRKGVS